jgi:site-specific recombinase XerD
LSLPATVGARPSEIVTLKKAEVNIGDQYLMLKVKGNWFKRSPISNSMAELLDQYLHSIDKDQQYLFLNEWNRPIDIRWIQRMVRDAGIEAGMQQRIKPIMFRHTFATYAADRHGKTITRALPGHCNLSHSTDVYMHLIPSKFRVLMNLHPYQTSFRKRKP